MSTPASEANKQLPAVLFSESFDIPWRGGEVKPETVRTALEEYITTDKNWGDVCEAFGISRRVWGRLINKYPQLRSAMALCRQEKAHILNEKAVGLYHGINKDTKLGDLPEWMQEPAKYGDKLSPAGVKLLKDQHDAFLNQAKVLERGQYNEKHQISVEADVNSQSIDIDMQKLMTMDITELAQVDTFK